MKKKYDNTKSVPRTIPKKAHPAVQLLIREMIKNKKSYRDVAERVGICPYTIYHWRARLHWPMMLNLESCLHVFGYELYARRMSYADVVEW